MLRGELIGEVFGKDSLLDGGIMLEQLDNSFDLAVIYVGSS